MNKKSYMGIGIGASRVKIVVVSDDLADQHVIIRDHHGNPRGVAEEMLNTINPMEIAGMAVTGREGAGLITGKKVYESEAVEECLGIFNLKPDVVVSLGGESFVVYPVGPDGGILDNVSGNRCAAGTVEFFSQQLGRMNIPIAEAADLAAEGKVVPLAKRCSVHCKSDCTHALNKRRCGVADIVRTLCYNMAEKVAGLVRASGINEGKMIVIGGAAVNPIVVQHIKELHPSFNVVVPSSAECFEALGAASIARKRTNRPPLLWSEIFAENGSSFGFLPPLSDYVEKVTFMNGWRGEIRPDGKYILGLDGGSTTTKAALLDVDTLDICADHYTRTNGNPEKAMKECLVKIQEKINASVGEVEPSIVGVCTTGSSGEILSVLCETPWHHNEIIAHAFGALHFYPEVDTIFEIGGQDSKFTLLRSRTAVDFNMNDACSAGTGSFIEETAMEDLGVPMERIADLALLSRKPPRFSDQCAAFANSDTRKAFQEGACKEDNLAGLIYAIVENYMNKVVGRRAVGSHILFQGGTSKNKAIAYAFAAKTGKHITVPPHSELAGCFGIALWLREKLMSGDAHEKAYSIKRILESKVRDSGDFTCKACENLCVIHNLNINGKKYPFGGQCSRWENARKDKITNTDSLNLVALRNHMLFHEYGVSAKVADSGHADSFANNARPLIGMQPVFSVSAFYPLYSHFFDSLGYDVRLAEKVDPKGVQRCQSARCYPYEIAHGTFYQLVMEGVRTIFAPHLIAMPPDSGGHGGFACPIAQALPYYLSAGFKDVDVSILSPVIDMINGLEAAEPAFLEMAVAMGHSEQAAANAFAKGCEMQRAFWCAARSEGEKALTRLEQENSIGVVLTGRPYNAFSSLANMGVPLKFASSGVTVMPCDFLPCDDEQCESSMYWKYGQMMIKSSRFIKKHPNLFAAYISNFGCGPDSFIQHFTGAILKEKPFLYLELDSHTADAGVATRVAAFLDVVAGYRKLGDGSGMASSAFVPAEIIKKDKHTCVKTSKGEVLRLSDKRVTLAFPSMGRYNTEAMAFAAKRFGYHAIALPPADDKTVAIGRDYTSGKECSPAIITVGSLMRYYRESFKKEREDEVLIFFMPTAGGPCRFGQYNIYMKHLVGKLEIEDVAFYAPTAEDGYRGLGLPFVATAWLAVVVGCLMQDVRALINVAAVDREKALAVFDDEWCKLLKGFSRGYFYTLMTLRAVSRKLKSLPLNVVPNDVPKVLLAGEIFVRSDELSCQGMDDAYANNGIMLKRADVSEWIYAMNWVYLDRLAGDGGYPGRFLGFGFFVSKLIKSLVKRDKSAFSFVMARLTLAFQLLVERVVRGLLSKSGLLATKHHDVDAVIRAGSAFLNPALKGEAVLTVGLALQVMEHSPSEKYCGVVFIGPFNCMPTGIAESIMKPYARQNGIPYLTIETDGSPMPSNFKSQMEVHILRAGRLAAKNSGSLEQT